MKFRIQTKWMVYYPNTNTRCQMFDTEKEAREFVRIANNLSGTSAEMCAKVKDLLSHSNDVFKPEQP